MTKKRIIEILANSNWDQLQSLNSEELKELHKFLALKNSEVNFILKGRALSKHRHSSLHE